MAVAELLLGAFISVLFQRLASPELLRFALREGIHRQLKKWRTMLNKIQAVLADAEERHIRDDSGVKLWLDDLIHLAYDVDDLLDEFDYDATAFQQKKKKKRSTTHQASTSNKVRCLVPSYLNPCTVVSNLRMESKIKEITSRFQDILKQKEELHLMISGASTTVAGRESDVQTTASATTSLVDESCVFGRQKDKEAILQLLLQGIEPPPNASSSSCSSNAAVGVIPIIGMGGLGKTTLAQLVYNDHTVKDSFHVRVWACVADDFHILTLTKTILRSVSTAASSSMDGMDLNLLQEELKNALFGKKFLIILDDVWNENYDKWSTFVAPFSTAVSGCRIIVTTRNEGVASSVGNFKPYRLKQLSDDLCLSIFAHHALGTKSFDAHPNLANVGKEIVKKCQGLPLAAKMLGGLLRNKNTPQEWANVLHSQIWDLPESGILPALKLSYHHLPLNLKQCFAYCSLFPAGYEFDKDELILLWMAEGFLQPLPNQKKQMEDLGGEYFYGLLSRSFFQPLNTTPLKFVMHDLIHDLAQFVAGNVYFHMENELETAMIEKVRLRHSSFVRGMFDIFKRFESFSDMKCLRTFLALPIETRLGSCYLSPKVLLYLLPKLKRLRVVSLSHYQIRELPNSVEHLKHLRYLNMSGTKIKCLPGSVTSLFNLFTLILRSCHSLTELPPTIWNLVNLRCLDLDDTPNLREMPTGMDSMTSLRKLSKFVVGKNEGLGIGDLKNLCHLRGRLSILGLHNVTCISDAREANLKDKEGLDLLCMKWSCEFDDFRNDEVETQVLELLQPPKSIRELEIVCYGGTKFPCWMTDSFYAANMVRLRIDGCKKITSLPSLGRLPSLKELTMCDLVGVTSVGAEFYGYDTVFATKSFPSLETLSIYNMREWEEWSCCSAVAVAVAVAEGEEFSNLRALSVKNCPKLIHKLPCHLPSLQKFDIENCPKLVGDIPSQLPCLKKLDIANCPLLSYTTTPATNLRELKLQKCIIGEGVDLSALTSLSISEISEMRCLNGLKCLTSLAWLEIRNCPRLVSFGGDDTISLASTLKHLVLLECEALETVLLPLQPDENYCMEELVIRGCSSLASISFPKLLSCCRVKSLSITNCKRLDSLPEEISNGEGVFVLEKLEIWECPSLRSFPSTRGHKLTTALKSLTVGYCESLKHLPLPADNNDEGMMMMMKRRPSASSSLEDIHVVNCASLRCFLPEAKLPTSLKRLRIKDCSQLTSIPETVPGSSLEEIDISGCRNLKRLMPGSLLGLTNLIQLWIQNCAALEGLWLPDMDLNMPSLKLRSLKVWGCSNLSSLPPNSMMINNLISLSIYDCPALETTFLQGGFNMTLNLTKLEIGGSPNLLQKQKHMPECGLHSLTSLKSLTLYGDGGMMDDMVSFPDNDHDHNDNNKCLLPTSITKLTINSLKNVESLSNSLQNLIFLQQLEIWKCPKLCSLPKHLPRALGHLWIYYCPILGKRCEKDKGGIYWPNISHIPCIQIDGRLQN